MMMAQMGLDDFLKEVETEEIEQDIAEENNEMTDDKTTTETETTKELFTFDIEQLKSLPLEELTFDDRVYLAEQGERLDELVSDEDYRVRELVATHGVGVHMTKLIRDKDPVVRSQAAMYATKTMITKMDNDSNRDVQIAIDSRKKELKMK